MNVQRLIEKYGEKFKLISKDFPYDRALSELWYDIKNLDEPEKVKVPQFVADVIEGAREQSVELEDAFEYVWEVADGELREWFKKLENRNNFARAYLDGYEVEKEKRYTVVMKETKQPLYYNALDEKLFFSMGGLATNFTRKQLEEAGFGWVFDCEGVEIEEVEK